MTPSGFAPRPRSRARGARRALAPGLLLLALASRPAAAQTLQGRVLQSGTGTPIAGASLTLVDRGGKTVATAAAGDSGTFRIRGPYAAEYQIRVEHVAYTTATVGPVRLNPSGFVDVTLRLDPRVVPVDALTVEVERRVRKLENAGFYDRRTRGLGQFMERTDIEERPARTATDVMRRLRGLSVLVAGSSTDVAGRGLCRPVVYIDGVAVSNRRRGSIAFNLDDLPVQDIEGIEFYSGPSSAPPQYSLTDNSCGVLMFWTTKPGR